MWLSDGLGVSLQYEELREWLDLLLEAEDDAEFINKHGFSTDWAIKQAQERLFAMPEDDRWEWLDIVEGALGESQEFEDDID